MDDFYYFYYYFHETAEHKILRREFSRSFREANELVARLDLRGVSYDKLWAISFSAYTGTSSHKRAVELGVRPRALYRAMDDFELDGHVARVKSVIRVLLTGQFLDTVSLYEAVKTASAPQPSAPSGHLS